MKVLVFGFSENTERYSNMAAQLLEEYGHETVKFNPRIDNIAVLKDQIFDTITFYVSKPVLDQFKDSVLPLKCTRVIFNPGTENSEIEQLYRELGIEVVRGCTLVMLKTKQF